MRQVMKEFLSFFCTNEFEDHPNHRRTSPLQKPFWEVNVFITVPNPSPSNSLLHREIGVGAKVTLRFSHTVMLKQCLVEARMYKTPSHPLQRLPLQNTHCPMHRNMSPPRHPLVLTCWTSSLSTRHAGPLTVGQAALNEPQLR